jgi:hypothetical protein
MSEVTVGQAAKSAGVPVEVLRVMRGRERARPPVEPPVPTWCKAVPDIAKGEWSLEVGVVPVQLAGTLLRQLSHGPA